MASYQSDMLNFSYDATLHISHPKIDPDTITSVLNRKPSNSHRRGKPRITPNGQALTGIWPENYWKCALLTHDQQDITEFLTELIQDFYPHQEFLRKVSESGGEVCIFLGVFSDRCCAHQFNRRLLRSLADIGFDLRLDFYGRSLPQESLKQ